GAGRRVRGRRRGTGHRPCRAARARAGRDRGRTEGAGPGAPARRPRRAARGSGRRGRGGGGGGSAPGGGGAAWRGLLCPISSSREAGMRREGSPWRGMGIVFLKELSDHLTSVRMRVLEWLVVLTGIAAIYSAISQIREVTAEDPFLFLRLFTRAGNQLPLSFVSLLSFLVSLVSFLSSLVPLVAIGLGFDLVNSEHNQRTLSRILAQPIYRDALLFGKFLGGLATIAIGLVALWLLVIGLGLVLLGLPPSVEE